MIRHSVNRLLPSLVAAALAASTFAAAPAAADSIPEQPPAVDPLIKFVPIPDDHLVPGHADSLAFPDGERLDLALRHLIESYVRWYPTAASAAGLREADTLLENRSRRYVDAAVMEMDAFRLALKGFTLENFDPGHRMDYKAAGALVERIRSEAFTLRDWQRNPVYYVDILRASVATPAADACRSPEDRIRMITARERRFGALVDAAKENLLNPPEVLTGEAIRQTRRTAAYLEEDLPPAAVAGVSDSALVAAFRAENAAAVAAVREYARFLEEDLAKKSTGAAALGAQTMDTMLQESWQLNMRAERVLDAANAELTKVSGAFRKSAGKLPGGGDPGERIRRLLDEHPGSDEILASARAAVADAAGFVSSTDFASRSDGAPPEVAELRGWDGGPFHALPGPYAGDGACASRVVLVAPPAEKGDAPSPENTLGYGRWALGSAALREAYPGRLLQAENRRALSTTIRKVSEDRGNVEGWAAYAGGAAVEAGFGGGDPAASAVQLYQDQLGLCRLVASLRVHTGAMTLLDAAKFFREQAFLTPEAALVETQRIVSDPRAGDAALGRIAIRKLRADWTGKRKDSATPRAFHDAFLAYGPMPLKVIRAEMLNEALAPLF